MAWESKAGPFRVQSRRSHLPLVKGRLEWTPTPAQLLNYSIRARENGVNGANSVDQKVIDGWFRRTLVAPKQLFVSASALRLGSRHHCR